MRFNEEAGKVHKEREWSASCKEVSMEVLREETSHLRQQHYQAWHGTPFLFQNREVDMRNEPRQVMINAPRIRTQRCRALFLRFGLCWKTWGQRHALRGASLRLVSRHLLWLASLAVARPPLELPCCTLLLSSASPAKKLDKLISLHICHTPK